MSWWESYDWEFWIGDARCELCGRFLRDAEPVLSEQGGVRAVQGSCRKHGTVQSGLFAIADREPVQREEA